MHTRVYVRVCQWVRVHALHVLDVFVRVYVCMCGCADVSYIIKDQGLQQQRA